MSQRKWRWLQFELGYGFGQPRKSPLIQKCRVSVEGSREKNRQTARHDRGDDREITVPQQTRHTAVEGSGVRTTVGCMSAGSTEAVQKERIQKRRAWGRRVDNEPTNPLDKQTDTLLLSWCTNAMETCTEWTPPCKSKDECHTHTTRTPQYAPVLDHFSILTIPGLGLCTTYYMVQRWIELFSKTPRLKTPKCSFWWNILYKNYVGKVPEFSAEFLCLHQWMAISDEGREILPKIWELFHHNLTLCAECFIRNYVSRVQKLSLPNVVVLLPNRDCM